MGGGFFPGGGGFQVSSLGQGQITLLYRVRKMWEMSENCWAERQRNRKMTQVEDRKIISGDTAKVVYDQQGTVPVRPAANRRRETAPYHANTTAPVASPSNSNCTSTRAGASKLSTSGGRWQVGGRVPKKLFVGD
jgi:hypothetical protein